VKTSAKYFGIAVGP